MHQERTLYLFARFSDQIDGDIRDPVSPDFLFDQPYERPSLSR